MDYKIISKTIANRLKVVLPELIHHNQVGYITGRNIAENLKALSDIFDYTKDFNVPGILISVDFHWSINLYMLFLKKLTWNQFFVNGFCCFIRAFPVV